MKVPLQGYYKCFAARTDVQLTHVAGRCILLSRHSQHAPRGTINNQLLAFSPPRMPAVNPIGCNAAAAAAPHLRAFMRFSTVGSRWDDGPASLLPATRDKTGKELVQV